LKNMLEIKRVKGWYHWMEVCGHLDMDLMMTSLNNQMMTIKDI
jgi:hypothetical protein